MKRWLLLFLLIPLAWGSYAIAAEINHNVEVREIETYPLISPSASIDYGNFAVWGEYLVLENEDYLLSKVHGSSMRPVMADGGIILVKPATKDDIAVGDFIGYQKTGGQLTFHQVVEIGEDDQGWFCWTKGTSCFKKDALIIREDDAKYKVMAVFY